MTAHLMGTLGSIVYLVTLLSYLFKERDGSQRNHHMLISTGKVIEEPLRHFSLGIPSNSQWFYVWLITNLKIYELQ